MFTREPLRHANVLSESSFRKMSTALESGKSTLRNGTSCAICRGYPWISQLYFHQHVVLGPCIK